MKLLLTMNIPYFPTLGGADKANRLLAEAFAQKNHVVRVVVPALATPSRLTYADILAELANRKILVATNELGYVFRLNGVELHAVVEPAHLRACLVDQIHEFKPDWTLVSSEGPSQNLLDAAIKESQGRVVCIVHTLQHLPFGPQSFFPSPQRTELLKEAAVIMAASQFVQEYIKQWSGLESVFIPINLYGSKPFMRLGSISNTFVTMVNPCAIKGISIFLALARLLPEVQFAAVPSWGTTNEDREALEQLSNVKLLKPVETIDDIFAKTRVLLMPSLWAEGWGRVVVESMLRGIPVLASKVGGIPEAKLGTDFVFPVRPIERFTDRFDENMIPIPIVPDQDISPWRDSLSILLSDRKVYEKQSEHARETALRFVSNIGVEPFEDILNRLVEGSKVNFVSSHGYKEKEASNNESKEYTILKSLADLTPEQRALMSIWLQKKKTNRIGRKRHLPSIKLPLVGIQTDGTRHPFFCMHSIGGGSLCYIPLSRYLTNRPFYGLQAQGLNGEKEPFTQIEQMAVHYRKAIQGLQPQGPYFLGGWSMGGVVAFEVAQQLKARSQQVALLALIDSYVPSYFRSIENDIGHDDTSILVSFLRMNGVFLGKNHEELEESLRKYNMKQQLDYLNDQLKISNQEQLQMLNLMLPSVESQQLHNMLRVFIGNWKAVQCYKPKVYPNQLTIFRVNTQRSKEATLGWGEFTSESVQIHEVTGRHFTILNEPYVRVLAEKLNGCIDITSQI